MFSPSPSLNKKLLSLLLKYESLFDGTLGDWNRPPVSIGLKEGAKPYHGRPYPIPHIHIATLMKEINRLVSIGVMNRQSSLQWASPTFIKPKKDMTVRTIPDLRERNKRIVRQPYPISKHSTTLTLQELGVSSTGRLAYGRQEADETLGWYLEVPKFDGSPWRGWARNYCPLYWCAKAAYSQLHCQ